MYAALETVRAARTAHDANLTPAAAGQIEARWNELLGMTREELYAIPGSEHIYAAADIAPGPSIYSWNLASAILSSEFTRHDIDTWLNDRKEHVPYFFNEMDACSGTV